MYKYNVSNHIEKVKNEVAKLLEGDNSGHGLEHINRVLDLSLKFAEKENANKYIVSLIAFDLRKLFFLFIGKFDAALNTKALSLRTNGGYQYLMYKGFTIAADKECAFWLEAENFLRTSENSGIKSTYSATLLQQFTNGIAQGLSGNNVAVNSDISFQKRHPNYPHPMSEIIFGVHGGTQKMKSGSRFIILGIDY